MNVNSTGGGGQIIETFLGRRCPCPAIWGGGFNNDANSPAPPIVVREHLWDLFLCQKTGEETRQEESRGDGGEKEGTLIFGGM